MQDSQAESDSPGSADSTHLTDLPGEILSHICSFLPLSDLIPFLTLHSSLLGLTQTHLSPIRHAINSCITHGPPYPRLLARLPSLRLLLPPADPDGALGAQDAGPGAGEPGALFLPLLVRARPRWIVEQLEWGRWREAIWREAFERRFLPSWKRYKVEGDSWRAAYLRVLGKLEHRNGGCTHEESWTVETRPNAQRFVTLHRNGSASLNRIYSRQFDPYQIYDELKRQANYSQEPTTVRVIVHLQDVRILAVGVLLDQPSLFVNSNAHAVLHPPLLRDWDEYAIDDAYDSLAAQASPLAGAQRHAGAEHDAVPDFDPANNPLLRAVTPSSPPQPTVALPDPVPAAPASTRRATLTSLFQRRRSSATGPAPVVKPDTSLQASSTFTSGAGTSGSGSGGTVSRLGAMLTQVRSRDSGDEGKRRRSSGLGMGMGMGGSAASVMGRSRKGSGSSGRSLTIPAAALFAGDAPMPPFERRMTGGGEASGPTAAEQREEDEVDVVLGTQAGHAAEPAQQDALQPRTSMELEEEALLPASADGGARQPNSQRPAQRRMRARPYPTLSHPQPAPSHAFYPNWTPAMRTGSVDAGDADEDAPALVGVAARDESLLMDRRQLHAEIEDDYAGYLYSNAAAAEPRDGGAALDVEDGAVGGAGFGEDGNKERYVEWDGVKGRRRWVGPMIIVAQLHPPDHPLAQPHHVDAASPTEGVAPDLGARGMYMSLGFEDVDALFPWVQLRGGGAYEGGGARRGGMGFAVPGG